MRELRSFAPIVGTMPRMRRLAAAALATLWLLLPAGAHAQDKRKDETRIKGTVLLARTDRPVPGAQVRVLGGRADGGGRVFTETATTKKDGEYSVEVPGRPGLEFAVEARFDGGLFVGDSTVVKRGTTRTMDVNVWKTTSDPDAITITGDQLVVAQDESNTGVLEVVTVENGTRFAYIGRGRSMGAKDDDASPTLGFALPSEAVGQPVELVDSSLNRLYATETDFGFAATVAIPPGETTATYRYLIPGEGGRFDLTRRALYPTQQVTVLATDPLEIESDRLSFDGEEDIGSDEYRKWSSRNAFDAGDLIPVLAIAEGSASSSLWVGILIGFGVILLLVIVGVLLRARPPAPKIKKPGPVKHLSQEELVAAIAHLDLQHEGGEISDEHWTEERMRLKSLLIAAKERQPTS